MGPIRTTIFRALLVRGAGLARASRSSLSADGAARDEAVSPAAQMLRTFAKESFWHGQTWSMDGEDDTGRIVGRLPFAGSLT